MFRYFFSLALLACSGSAFALGLGELRGQMDLGDKLRLAVDVSGEGAAALDASCFRLVSPVAPSDIPWLKKASLSLRKGAVPVLEIRSESPLREPILQIAVQVGCGHEISREYMLLASPPKGGGGALPELPLVAAEPKSEAPVKIAPVKQEAVLGRARDAVEVLPRPRPGKPAKPVRIGNLPDRLLLSSGDGGGEPSLRLATELASVRVDDQTLKEAQRDVLRLEFKMLMALNAQAATQLEASEKLRNIEAVLSDLQQRSSELAQKSVEQKPALAASQAAPVPVGEDKGSSGALVESVSDAAGGDWWFVWAGYALAIGGVLAIVVWLGWRRRQAQLESDAVLPLDLVEPMVDPQREGESEGAIDLSIEPVGYKAPMHVDFELDLPQEAASPPVSLPKSSMAADSVLSISATTVDEHFEANPVMELADIMLSFGRVKGAAQALQEYIDNSPQEALQPWIRLMDVYRMAGMRNEFEAVARNLNQNFNVEIQQWEPDQPTPNRHTLDLVLDETVDPVAQPAGPRPERLEDMPRIMAMVVELWAGGDVVGYLQQLLRDNRGGKRIGFSLPVVEEILFLIDLKDTLSRMDKEGLASPLDTGS